MDEKLSYFEHIHRVSDAFNAWQNDPSSRDKKNAYHHALDEQTRCIHAMSSNIKLNDKLISQERKNE